MTAKNNDYVTCITNHIDINEPYSNRPNKKGYQKPITESEIQGMTY